MQYRRAYAKLRSCESIDIDAECNCVVDSHGNYIIRTATDSSDYIIPQEVIRYVRLDKFENEDGKFLCSFGG